MNYGFDNTTPGWKGERKQALADALTKLVLEYGEGKKFTGNPYIEVDGLYPGVRIRKITDLKEEKQRELTQRADDIYREVMGIKAQ